MKTHWTTKTRFAAVAVALGTAQLITTGCVSEVGSESEDVASTPAESCMSCHNGSSHNDYGGSGLENPHPFPGAATLKCTTCHGGNPNATTAEFAHVPPPPEIGDREFQDQNAEAYFNRLTLTGIDKYEDYTVNGITYSPIDYLQFIQPGDLRVITQDRSCGKCHMPHVECVTQSPLATAMGMFSSSLYTTGLPNSVNTDQNYEDTEAEYGFRAVVDEDFTFDASEVGAIPQVAEFPVFSGRDDDSPDAIFNNLAMYSSTLLGNDLNADNSVKPNSALGNLFHEQVAFTCGDCHLGSAGANNRYGDFRSSGCTSCHMRYALDGRSRSTDPNINKFEPADPDNIDDPERPHVNRHLITSVARTLATGEEVQGMDDYTCAGCHQGSNRTVMQFWGIRLDQNQDVRRGNQYPVQPAAHQGTHGDERLFDPVVGNNTFNGRNRNQYLLYEDYDNDTRDDTPPDVHYEAGLGCIDCHGSHDLHGGTVGDPTENRIWSRQEQAVAVQCEDCHGGIDEEAETVPCVTYDGELADCAVDSQGNPMRHVTRDDSGNYYLKSRLTGKRHYVKQTRDTVVNSGKTHPFTSEPVYNAKASYAMGRVGGPNPVGIGPQQSDASKVSAGFSHTTNMSCVSCHASWTNNCIGCHLVGEYANDFSNITGERIVYRELGAEFVYQSPVPFQLGVNAHNQISPISANTTTFYSYVDQADVTSEVFAFSDRHGNGNNPGTGGRGLYGALSHNSMMPHSIRGKVSEDFEGPRYCVACHLTDENLTAELAEYNDFRARMASSDPLQRLGIQFDTLKVEIGQNTGNQRNTPYWVHMVAGLGSGLFMVDENGCPTNPIDANDDRFNCNDLSPQDRFDATDPNLVVYDLDRIVENDGTPNGSNNHPMLKPGVGTNLRDGPNTNPNLAGPLGQTLIRRLTDPDAADVIILDSWIDADGELGGSAGDFVPE